MAKQTCFVGFLAKKHTQEVDLHNQLAIVLSRVGDTETNTFEKSRPAPYGMKKHAFLNAEGLGRNQFDIFISPVILLAVPKLRGCRGRVTLTMNGWDEINLPFLFRL